MFQLYVRATQNRTDLGVHRNSPGYVRKHHSSRCNSGVPVHCGLVTQTSSRWACGLERKREVLFLQIPRSRHQLANMASAYSQEQIARFLSYIKLPSRYQELDKIPRDLQFLTVLTTHTLSTVPYENLSLHYSSDHKIDLNPHVLYKKIVGGARGRGGYCMENSILFNHILRGLGFDVYTAGVRIRPRVDGMPQGDYMGW